MCRSGSDSKNNKRIPKWDVNRTVHMPSVKSSPRLRYRGKGRMSGRLCCWARAFQIQLLKQPACVAQIPMGVFSLETFVRRFLMCVGFWGPMVQISQALLCPEVLCEPASTPVSLSGKNLGHKNKLQFLRICCYSVFRDQKGKQMSTDLNVYTWH